MGKAGSDKIALHQADSATKVLKEDLQLQKGKVIDATKMSTAKMCEFFEAKMAVYSEKKLMTPLRVKATRRKVPNPIILGQCVKIYFKDVFAKHGDDLAQLKASVNYGLGDLYGKIAGHPKEGKILADIEAVYASRPGHDMVDYGNGKPPARRQLHPSPSTWVSSV